MVVAMKLEVPDRLRRHQSADVKLDLQLLDLNEDQEIEAPENAKPFAELRGAAERARPRRARRPRRLLAARSAGSGGGTDQQNLEEYSEVHPGRRRRQREDRASAPDLLARRSARPRIIHPVSQAQASFNLRRFLLSGDGWPYFLVPFIPIADRARARPRATPTSSSSTSALGVIPTAALMGRATEELAARSGPGIGGLLNVTFGNAPELIIAFFALNEGLHEVVKASLVGSILGNILLVMGAAMLVGGLKRERQRFDAHGRRSRSR